MTDAEVEEAVEVPKEILRLINCLTSEAWSLQLLDCQQRERLLINDAALWRLLRDYGDDSLRHDLEKVRAGYTEDQLCATYFVDGYSRFTRTGILVHYCRDQDEGIRVLRCSNKTEYEFNATCHVQTCDRWREVMEAAYDAFEEALTSPQSLLKRHASAGPPAAQTAVSAASVAASGRRRQRRVRATANAQKYEVFAKEAQNRHRTGKTLEQISHEIFGTKTKKAAKPKIERCREWIKGNQPKLKWWGVSDA